jgi:2-phospho-L-lactate/phosphoenolpyruvate guanylyltransferase
VPGAPLRPSPLGFLPDIGSHAVLIPVKAFGEAKGRLHAAFGPDERARLARAMADTVADAAQPLPVAVVCDDAEVAAWARRRGALVIWEPGRGLNGAVEAGVDHLAANGVRQVIVSHADLPHATNLPRVGDTAGITLVPDRYGNGTNVIALPTYSGFRFSYGPGSFARHRNEADRLGLPVRILDRPDLAYDVDEPGDVESADLEPVGVRRTTRR